MEMRTSGVSFPSEKSQSDADGALAVLRVGRRRGNQPAGAARSGKAGLQRYRLGHGLPIEGLERLVDDPQARSSGSSPQKQMRALDG